MARYGKWALRAILAGGAALAVIAAFAPPSPEPGKPVPVAKDATSWSVFAQNARQGNASIQSVRGVTVAPSGGVWGTGYRVEDGISRPVVQRWAGGGFRAVSLPKSWCGRFTTIDASSGKNVWAFGNLWGFGDDGAPYSARWNGTRWTEQRMLRPFSVSDAEASSASDVWAVSPGGEAQRWGGSSWKRANIPIKATALDADEDAQMWAVGHRLRADGMARPGAARWDGSRWTELSPPEMRLPNAEARAVFTDVAMVTTTNMWAVGNVTWVDENQVAQSDPILAHYADGTWKTWINDADASYDHVVQDGQGGVYILQGQQNPAVLHGRDGVWTRRSLPRTSGHDATVYSLERDPVTSLLWSSGFQVTRGAPSTKGAYWRGTAG